MTKRILAVVSSVPKLPSGQPAGFTLEELAAPYQRFREAGFAVDIASPAGGVVSHDPAYASGVFLSNDGVAFLTDAHAQSKIADTIPLKEVKTELYDAVFLVGGAAAAGDFDANPELNFVLSAIASRGGTIAAICHGVVGLTNLLDAQGVLLAKGHPMTGFSLDEEVAANLIDEVAVVPEERLRAIGALYTKAPELWGACVVEGPLFITGQNPASAKGLAEAVINRLKSS